MKALIMKNRIGRVVGVSKLPDDCKVDLPDGMSIVDVEENTVAGYLLERIDILTETVVELRKHCDGIRRELNAMNTYTEYAMAKAILNGE